MLLFHSVALVIMSRKSNKYQQPYNTGTRRASLAKITAGTVQQEQDSVGGGGGVLNLLPTKVINFK